MTLPWGIATDSTAKGQAGIDKGRARLHRPAPLMKDLLHCRNTVTHTTVVVEEGQAGARSDNPPPSALYSVTRLDSRC